MGSYKRSKTAFEREEKITKTNVGYRKKLYFAITFSSLLNRKITVVHVVIVVVVGVCSDFIFGKSLLSAISVTYLLHATTDLI